MTDDESRPIPKVGGRIVLIDTGALRASLGPTLGEPAPHQLPPDPGEPVVDDRRTWEQATEALDDPFARRLARLHTPHAYRHDPWCDGCDPGEYADTAADWPCTTAEAVLEELGLPTTGSTIRPEKEKL